MPLNLLFWIILSLLVVFAVITWRVAYVREGRPRTKTGPVPGYSVTAGSEMDLEPESFLLDPESWRPVLLETFHSPDRSRIILQVHVDAEDPQATRQFLRTLAQDLQARSHAQVVLVETDQDSPVTMKYLYSPDRRGWSGEAEVSELFWEA